MMLKENVNIDIFITTAIKKNIEIVVNTPLKGNENINPLSYKSF